MVVVGSGAEMLKTFQDVWARSEQRPSREAPPGILHGLGAIHEMVSGAPPTVGPEELRRRSCEAFVELFEGTDHLVLGEEQLPETSGHVFIMNHLSNHPANVLAHGFIPTLDTHFVSAMILFKKYGEPPVRVVRKSNPGEEAHQKYYDRLSHIYVEPGCTNPAKYRLRATAEERRRPFLEEAGRHLREARNVVICPEGDSTGTDTSPLPFKAGAFRLAASVRPEPLLVPIAVANFDKETTRTRTVAAVHEPIRLSEHIGETFDDRSLHGFINDYVHERFRRYVREAVRLAG
jgi:hypothetical protein